MQVADCMINNYLLTVIGDFDLICENLQYCIFYFHLLVFRLLPDTLLHCLNCIHLLVLHRQLLADTLLMDRPTMQNAGNTHHQYLQSKTEILIFIYM